jgi:putative membrane protein
VNREAQGIVMFVFGGAVLHAGLTDVYLRYVRAGLRPLLLVAGVVLIIVAIATLWYELRPARGSRGEHPEHPETPEHLASTEAAAEPAPVTEAGHGHGHSHGHREPRIAWLLLLPLFALIVVAPPALGSYAADRTGTALTRPLGFDTLPASGPLQLTVIDYAGRAVYDHGRSLAGRQIQLTGFIAQGSQGTPYLTRMVLNCCAADALPIKVALEGKVPTTLGRDAWVTVSGTYSAKQIKDAVNGGAIPYLDVTSTTPIKAPDDEYED